MKKIPDSFVPSNFISYIYLPATLLFYEILVFCLAGFVFDAGNFIAMILISIATGSLLNLLCSLSESEKRNARLVLIIIELIAVIVMIFYFVQDTYQNFVNIATIFAGAGGIVKEFGTSVINIIKHNILLILLFEAPAIIFLFLGPVFKVLRFRKNKPRAYLFLFLFALILEIAGAGLTVRNQDNRIKLMAQYDFNTVARCFNLETALKTDLAYLAFGNPFGCTFVPEDHSEYMSGSKDAASSGSVASGSHDMGIDFTELSETETDPKLKSMHNYVGSLSPAPKNSYTGLFKRKNLVFLSVESMSLEMISEDTMPTLYRMQQEGIVFQDYYQPYWNGSTSTGEFSNLMGIIPTGGMYSYESTRDNNLYLTIGNALMRKGYFSRAYHNGTVEYYDRHLILPNFGYEDFIANGNGMEEGLSGNLPESDLEMLQYAVPQFIDRESFNIYFMTLSGHFPYFYEQNIMIKKYGNLIADKGYSDFVAAYICSQIDLDKAMEYLLEKLKDAGVYEDTVIVLAPDHYPYGLTRNDAWGTDRDYLPELFGYQPQDMMDRDHNALIIWSPVLEEMDPVVITEPSYSVDILPTLLNLFDLEYDSRLLAGRDVLSETEGLVIWPDYSWRTSKGTYYALENRFVSADGSVVDPAYIENMKAIVRNKMTFSFNVIELDYYNKLFRRP